MNLQSANVLFQLGWITALVFTDQLAVLVELEGWESIDLEVGTEIFGLNGVDLDELDGGEFRGKLGEDWSNLLAVAAPRSPEVNNSDTRSGGSSEGILVSDFSDSSTGGISDRVLVGSREVFLGFLWISLHGQISWLPVGWADFTVDFNELESLDETDDLINVAADWKIIDSDLAEVASWVNDEESTQWNTVWQQDTVLVGNSLVEVSHNWDLHVTKSTISTWGVDPGKVSEQGIARGSDDLSVDLLELWLTITEGDDLSWANKGEIQWIPEEDNPLATVISKGDVLELL